MGLAVIVLTAVLGGLSIGYDTGSVSGALLFLRRSFHLSSLMEGVVTGIALAGAAAGASVAGVLADRFGRRPLLVATASIFLIGAVLSGVADQLSLLLAGRVLVGIGVGSAAMLTPLYLAEIAPPARRGALVAFNQLAVTVGVLGSDLVGYGFASDRGWRWMLGLGGVPALLLAVGMLLLPETPFWLTTHGRINRARVALRRVRPHGTDIEAELDRVRDEQQRGAAMRTASTGKKRLRAGPVMLPVVAGLGLALFQPVAGINTVIFFAPTIFRAAGLSSASAAILATAGIGLINVLVTMCAIWLVDRVGRRVLLLVGLSGTSIASCLIGIGFMLQVGPIRTWLVAGSLAAYVACFAIGLGAVFWLLVSEIFPLPIRARGMSMTTVVNSLASLLVTLFFLDLVNTIGQSAVFFLSAVLTLAACVFVAVMIPETRNVELEEIGALWRTWQRTRLTRRRPARPSV